MNTKVIAGIVIAVVVLGGGYFLLHGKSSKNEVASNTQSAPAAAQTSTQTSSIQSLITAGTSQKCSYTSNQADAVTTGTIYVASGKMRGDISATVKTGTTVTHIINDGSTSYMWSDDGKFAFKMAFNPKDAQAVSDTANQRAVDLKQNYDFHCDSWSADASMFNLPTGITFTAMPGMPAGASAAAAAGTPPSSASSMDTKAAQTAVCNSLSGTAKDQCLKALQ